MVTGPTPLPASPGKERVAGAVDLIDITQAFLVHGEPLPVLDHVDLSVAPGQFVSLVGPSGSGKSTLLRLVAGLDRPVTGTIYVDGRRVTGPDPSRGLVFQDPTLLPWLTVARNVALGPTIQGGKDDPGWRARIDAMIAMVGLDDFRDALPAELSGGMAQRASLARALVTEPEILLLDEPLGKLDALTRAALQTELARLWQHQGFTAIMVTHDVEEALLLSDRVVVFSPRPARVVADIAVDLDRPRTQDDPDFRALRRRILDLLA
ncbi:ABC transporter ATP-binding protein [Raineyella sp. W15-4]|uniref:ABC transporter ATP-binding protein n=1 Tax=Raineyella sp. W15-4 TaxID=3081651 RepID=UPI0029540D74|nr:ABC transporter ATP-binding protein [Raineyella sp. W15-4]WOQ17329.1 ABC transporter ATP-binding protein [Raineyella sp. W15-4]